MKKPRLREDKWPVQCHSGTTFMVELELEPGWPRLQNLPSKGQTLLPWRGEWGTQLVLLARVPLWHKQSRPEATGSLLHSCLCPSAHFKCKWILWSALKTQKLLLYTNMKPEGSQRPVTPNSSTSYIPNSMGGMKPEPTCGVNITCVTGGWLMLPEDWRSGFPDFCFYSSAAGMGAFALDWPYFQNYFQKWERNLREKKHLRSSFPLWRGPDSFVTITKDQWQVFTKRKSIWVTLPLQMYLTYVNVEVIYKLQIILYWYPPCAQALLLVGKLYKTIRGKSLRRWSLEPQLLKKTPTCTTHVLIL